VAIASSPINHPTKRPEPSLSPGCQSMPGAARGDNTTHIGNPAPGRKDLGALPEPSAPPTAKADAVDGPVHAHLARHAMLRAPK
jgi:hypothetical protein